MALFPNFVFGSHKSSSVSISNNNAIEEDQTIMQQVVGFDSSLPNTATATTTTHRQTNKSNTIYTTSLPSGSHQQSNNNNNNVVNIRHTNMDHSDTHYYGATTAAAPDEYSDRAIGGRPLGSQAVACVRKLEKKERSTRRMSMLLMKHQQSSASSINQNAILNYDERSPLKRNSATAAGSDVHHGNDGYTYDHQNLSGEVNSSIQLYYGADDQYHNNDAKNLHVFGPGNTESVGQALYNIIFGKTVSLLLLIMPLTVWANYFGWSPVWIFWLNFAVLIPLATILSDFTEEVAAHTNQTLGGLINATFGNAVEVLVGIQALLSNEIRVVQASMLGSIFSNLLLVLGSCFFFGGLYHKEQRFNSTAATANMGLLALSSIALVLPTPFAEYYKIQDEHVLTISRVAAIFLMFMYLQLLIFQLKTHAHLFEDDTDSSTASAADVKGVVVVDAVTSIPMWVAMSGLLIATIMISMFSECLVQSIDGFCESSGISRTFVGLIILPFVGNAIEHVAAVTVAMKDKMDLAMGVAVGSCTQISLFVTPLMVLIGWGLERNMTLNFPHFEIILYVMAVVTVSICLSSPKGNWLEGSLLITTYLMIATGFWFENVVDF